MPQFTYTARDVKGEMKQATIEAPNRDEVMNQLRKQKLQVIKVDEGTGAPKKRSGSIKMRGGELKHVLKRALEGVLPREVLHRGEVDGLPEGHVIVHNSISETAFNAEQIEVFRAVVGLGCL